LLSREKLDLRFWGPGGSGWLGLDSLNIGSLDVGYFAIGAGFSEKEIFSEDRWGSRLRAARGTGKDAVEAERFITFRMRSGEAGPALKIASGFSSSVVERTAKNSRSGELDPPGARRAEGAENQVQGKYCIGRGGVDSAVDPPKWRAPESGLSPCPFRAHFWGIDNPPARIKPRPLLLVPSQHELKTGPKSGASARAARSTT